MLNSVQIEIYIIHIYTYTEIRSIATYITVNDRSSRISWEHVFAKRQNAHAPLYQTVDGEAEGEVEVNREGVV